MPYTEVDLAIVGAGLHGIAMAKTFHAVYPGASIVILDRAQTLGGTWAQERLYPTLKTNNGFGTYEYSDFPMDRKRYRSEALVHIPGHVVHQYLSDAAQYFDVAQFLLLQTNVDVATLDEDGKWKLSLSRAGSPSFSITATKLVLATGLTSEPSLPDFPGMNSFEGPIIHSKQLKDSTHVIESCKRAVVVGGNKSSWDVCYKAARSGTEVHMIIRPSGGGPSYLWPRKFSFGPCNWTLASLTSTRAFSLFDPAPFGQRGMLHYLLHHTWLGSRICAWFWRLLDTTIKRTNGYDDHPETKKLKPWYTPFWVGNSLSIHNYETDWFEFVREGKVHVHISDVSSVVKQEVHLTDGSVLPAEVLVCCTGWKTQPSIQFSYKGTQLNLPSDLADEAPSCQDDAMKEVMSAVPYLGHMRRRTAEAPEATPMAKRTNELPISYRYIVPCNNVILPLRSLGFIGYHSSVHAATVAEAQALWITAFFNWKLPSLDTNVEAFDNIRRDAMFHTVFTKLRRPNELGGSGGRYLDLIWDSIGYVDQLLGDLGLNPRRKKSWWRHWFTPYLVQDYRGMVDEWIAKTGRVASGTVVW